MTKQFYIKQLNSSILNNSVLCKYSFNVKKVPFQIIQFSISTQFKCKYGLIVKKKISF